MIFSSFETLFVLCLTLVSVINSVSGIDCYQCNSTDHRDPFQCGEYMTDDRDIEPRPCDSVYGAAFCIKHTGRFEVVMGPCMCMRLVYGIDCYQCTSATNIDCGAPLIHDIADSSLEPTSCGFMFEASYCIKTTGLHSGGLGTKRFCSSLDLGNYCNYIRQPGDMMEYRSCVYTCDSDGCNAGDTLRHSLAHIAIATLTLTFTSTKLFS